jgi:orotidine-5'-phosphate decarboxylase
MRPALRPEDRIIVALDVPTARDALALVDELGDLVSFYKFGLELLMANSVEAEGREGLLRTLTRDKKVFVDLKLPEIPATAMRVVGVASEVGARLLTLSNTVARETIAAAKRGRDGRAWPELLYVPFLSSLDETDFAEMTGQDPSTFHEHLLRRARWALDAGVDGFIVSGPEIKVFRDAFPDAPLVSPGIRPAGASTDDHKRSCTPAEAIRLGADFIVVGRPVRDAPNRRDAVRRIAEEIASAND